MLNGLSHVYINGVEFSSKIQTMTITNSFDMNVCEFDVMATESEVDFTPKAPLVLVIDTDNKYLFIGKLTRPQATEYRNGDYIQWKMIAQGFKNLYRNIPISKEFKTTAANQIFEELIENDEYISSTDLVGTVIDYDDELDISFTTNLTEAFDTLAEAVLDNEGAMWTVSYNVGSSKVEHNLEWKFDNKIADIAHVDLASMKPPVDDISTVKNIYKFTANDVLFPNQCFQDYLFEDPSDYIANNIDLENYQINLNLPGNCINIRLFLIAGEPSSDAADYHRFEKVTEIPVNLVGVDQASQSSITVDPELFLTGKINNLLPNSLENNNVLSSFNGFQGTLNKEPLVGVPESKHGYITVPNREYVWACFQSMYDPNIKTPKNILGYRIYFYRKENYCQIFKDDSSIASYGYRLQDMQLDNIPDVRWLESYASRLLTATAWPKKSGQFTLNLWKDGVRYYTDNPKAGDYCDVSFTKGDKTISLSDCYIYEAKYFFNFQKCECTITTKQVPNGYRPTLELKKIERILARLNSKATVEYKTVVTCTETVSLDSNGYETIYDSVFDTVWANADAGAGKETEDYSWQA